MQQKLFTTQPITYIVKTMYRQSYFQPQACQNKLCPTISRWIFMYLANYVQVNKWQSLTRRMNHNITVKRQKRIHRNSMNAPKQEHIGHVWHTTIPFKTDQNNDNNTSHTVTTMNLNGHGMQTADPPSIYSTQFFPCTLNHYNLSSKWQLEKTCEQREAPFLIYFVSFYPPGQYEDKLGSLQFNRGTLDKHREIA